jgi:alkylated DNA nucleotide flippase Atl1
MALTYIQMASLAGSGEFLSRVRISMLRTAANVYGEAANTVGHAARATLATRVMNNPDQYSARFVVICASRLDALANPNPSTATDTELDNALSSVWNAVAGA